MENLSVRKEIRSVLSESTNVSEIFGFGKKKELPDFSVIYNKLNDKYNIREFSRPEGTDYWKLWVGFEGGVIGGRVLKPSRMKYIVRVFDNGNIIIEDGDKGKKLKASSHEKAVDYMLSEYERKQQERISQKEKEKSERDMAIRTHDDVIPQ
jgi:hypothetical protein